MCSWLPGLVKLDDYQGDWTQYVEAIHSIFTTDFVNSAPSFRERRVGLKKHPMEKGKEATFWHLISAGASEADREIDLRRCERIRWPRPVVEADGRSEVCCWLTHRKGEPRYVIALDDFSYIVVLAVRKCYLVLWTAYCVEYDHQRRKLLKQYESTLK